MNRRLVVLALVVACGLALRMYGLRLGVPVFLVKYGGSALWGTMVFCLVALACGRGDVRAAAIAFALSVAVEFFRLYHMPVLDAFRLTLPGALLLGRIFSLWNILAYGAGIALGLAVEQAGLTRPS